MTESPFKLDRRTKIVATLGPSSSDEASIRSLLDAGVSVFRLNFSHGTHEEQKARLDCIRKLEKEVGRPVGILADLQGPKLRIGTFSEDNVHLDVGQTFTLYLDEHRGDSTGVKLPHPEVFAAQKVGEELLVDDGKIRLRITELTSNKMVTEVMVGGIISERKGVNVPGVSLPISPLTKKDRIDLKYALEIGVEWVALSFVQRVEDLIEARELIGGKAGLLAKLEKPSVLDDLENIVKHSDAIMVARGDLGVELPPERVPSIQKRIVQVARSQGKPVIVATQMLESMIHHPIPTRAEASDVATAIYDGVDAVMLSAETAAGSYPEEAVSVMGRIISETESDKNYRQMLQIYPLIGEISDADAIAIAASQIAKDRECVAVVTFTSTGSTALRAARNRGVVPILGLTPSDHVARKLSLVWGVYSIQTKDVSSFSEMVGKSVRMAMRKGIAKSGDRIVVTAGVPFGTPGSTNTIRLTKVSENYEKEE
ncbi:pyruvate kinase [Cocleimonas sp. KMM 6892]|uniref:pyruvate kinase n=1 Tax=unclassified Cocleimonas TaxID=2639732 RepID=UPI002DBB5989|nr:MULTISPECIES: pyruvate kinase [unclassified Cocleimonas]MEB8432711.1 pyruvate kinase [Cocleimonas sp. KMM 6892]MEC4715570.1 pyruvate kinase [Cocleimonas sp. KMM 6895]MEC4744812.1 pyruvate kinase [Cocleimonas sp. KMM 6896]